MPDLFRIQCDADTWSVRNQNLKIPVAHRLHREVVFDEKRTNVNYWEPWYLGYEPGKERQRGIPSQKSPRTGPYKTMIETGRDLLQL